MEQKPLTLPEIQQVSLEIVKKIHEICEELNLRYYLAYGTLIGAIRHQGFIPWDDDLDIMMPRADYRILQAYFRDHKQELAPLELLCPATNADYPYTIGRVSHSGYVIDTDNEKPCGLGVFVDVYPLDYVGNTEEEYTRIKNKASRYASLCFLSTRKRCTKGNTKSTLKLLVKFPAFLVAKLFGKKFFFRKLEKLALTYDGQPTAYIGCVEWGGDGVKDVYPVEWFGQGQALPFEDARLIVPDNYDSVLRRMYGDYMQLPPEEDRIAHHFYQAYRK